MADHHHHSSSGHLGFAFALNLSFTIIETHAVGCKACRMLPL